ncbi:hypothetical protein EJ03DRAFT_6439 [Teratosphaeria nubilosa]|uniref:Uncharacterized protein n=1 Tax=Teratosphaeria nubilosa TaxID=161662 RepID=A0A6G1LNC7_9PEZI|nr:hypothetical protein EJ03DRAFT_6439 [Teratosphaeria nubilosa]
MKFISTILSLALIATVTATAIPYPVDVAPGPTSFPANSGPSTKLDQETCGQITGQLEYYSVSLTATIIELYHALNCSPDSTTAHDFLLILVGGRVDLYPRIEAIIIEKITASGWNFVLTEVTIAELVVKCGLNTEIDTVAIFLATLDVDVHAYIAYWVHLSVSIGVSEQSCKVIGW